MYTNREKVLTLRINFDKYDDGNMFVRYLVTGVSEKILKNNSGIIYFNVELLDEKDNLISSFNVSEMEMGGIFGGINTLKMDTMKVITDYVENALLKK
jgi:hypothetical protein